jgi:hypothetical protein
MVRIKGIVIQVEEPVNQINTKTKQSNIRKKGGETNPDEINMKWLKWNII